MATNKSIFYDKNLIKRRKKAKIFKNTLFAFTCSIVLFLGFFLSDISIKAFPALSSTQILIDVKFTKKTLRVARSSVDRKTRKLVSRYALKKIVKIAHKHKDYIGSTHTVWLKADDQVDQYLKGHQNKLSESQKKIIDEMVKSKRVKHIFNSDFFTLSDSRTPENAGILSAFIGTLMTMIITMLISLPIGVATAIYLEEFAKDSPFIRFIEVNINNLAAIPSILFGILGLSVFINVFEFPRSSPLVGGTVLALMVLPIIIISSRVALKSVENKLKQAGYGLGYSRWQVIRHIVLPNAMPGILTGSILSLSQAIGETAPLIMVGMVLFVTDGSFSILEPSTVMPAQIFMWSSMPEFMFIEKTALAIMLLIIVMVTLNLSAIMLRKKLQK